MKRGNSARTRGPQQRSLATWSEVVLRGLAGHSRAVWPVLATWSVIVVEHDERDSSAQT
jgi:hypothetical protein